MKIYIAGAGGMLGDAFYNVFSKDYFLKCTDINLNENWLDFLDFRIFNNYFNDVKNFNPNYLFHLGAHTDLEYCEKNYNDAFNTNTLSVENAVHIANYLKIPLIYISTAGIFDGKKDVYDDWDVPNPICIYGKTKYAGELFVKNNSNKYFIFRPGWMMGGGIKKDKKFIGKIIKQIINGKKILNIVDDKFGTPTYTYDFAKNVKKVINSEFYGTYNLVCEGLTSRFQVAEEILKYFKLEKNIKIEKVNSDFFLKEYFVNRPASERLINSKLSIRSMNYMRDWKICLQEYLKNDFNNILN